MPVTINQAAIDELLYSRTGPVVRALEAVGECVVRTAKHKALVETGTTAGSIHADTDVHVGVGVAVTIKATSRAAIFQELGNDGSDSGRIYPTGRFGGNGRNLAFYSRGHFYTPKSTARQAFLRPALRECSPWPVVESF